MAQNKKSFVLYCDLIDNIDHLINEEKGILFNHLLEYVNDKNPVLEDRVLISVWKPIQRQLKRDLEKYEEKKGKKSISGREGNLKRWNLDLYNDYKKGVYNLAQAESIANGRKVSHTDKVPSQMVANIAVNDNDNDNVINNKRDEDEIFNNEYLSKYKIYCSELVKDTAFLESINRIHKISMDKEVCMLTIVKYLKLFLEHINISKEKHENKGKFNTHFSNWLRRQPTIEKTIPKQKPIRYV